MEIVYKELFRVNRPIYGPGPGGFFIKRFKKSGYSEAELFDLISGMDFSLAGADEDISLKKKCKIIERAVAETHYTSWVLRPDRHHCLSYGRRIFVCVDSQQSTFCRNFRGAIPDCLGNICMVSVLL